MAYSEYIVRVWGNDHHLVYGSHNCVSGRQGKHRPSATQSIKTKSVVMESPRHKPHPRPGAGVVKNPRWWVQRLKTNLLWEVHLNVQDKKMWAYRKGRRAGGKAGVPKKEGLGNLNNVNCKLNPATACEVFGSCAHRRTRRESTEEWGHSNNERSFIVQPYKT